MQQQTVNGISRNTATMLRETMGQQKILGLCKTILWAATFVVASCSSSSRPSENGHETDSDSESDTETATGSETETGPDTQCVGMDDFTICQMVTDPDRSYDICINETCQSPGCGTEECNPPGPHFPLPDTNQRLCYDNTSPIDCPSPGELFYGQDAQYGWDTSFSSSARYSRDIGDAGQPIVTDNVTGLFWQGCAMGRSGDDCAEGSPEVGSWPDAFAYCDSLSWGGQGDWRLPDRYELQSIVDYGRIAPSIDMSAFPSTTNSSVATSSHSHHDFALVWGVRFGDGQLPTAVYDYNEFGTRCVRGSPSPRSTRFSKDLSIPSQPVVLDAETNLGWQGCAMGLFGEQCNDGAIVASTWSGSLTGCEDLSWGGHDDWRLPSVSELFSITNDHTYNPAIDAEAFPNTLAGDEEYWTSSTNVGNNTQAWMVRFYIGSVASVVDCNKVDLNPFRCVR